VNKHEITEAAFAASVSGAASKATYGGAFGAVFGWVVSSEGVALIGICVAIAGFATNLFFRWREDRRQEREHQARMAQRDFYE
jgi:uncharacterized membrane protein